MFAQEYRTYVVVAYPPTNEVIILDKLGNKVVDVILTDDLTAPEIPELAADVPLECAFGGQVFSDEGSPFEGYLRAALMFDYPLSPPEASALLSFLERLSVTELAAG